MTQIVKYSKIDGRRLKKRGPKPKMTESDKAMARELYRTGCCYRADIALHYNVHKNTILLYTYGVKKKKPTSKDRRLVKDWNARVGVIAYNLRYRRTAP